MLRRLLTVCQRSLNHPGEDTIPLLLNQFVCKIKDHRIGFRTFIINYQQSTSPRINVIRDYDLKVIVAGNDHVEVSPHLSLSRILDFRLQPISTDERPKLANPCNVLGFLPEFVSLKKIKPGDKVRVEKA